MTALFAMIYRFMPRVAIRWGDVWIGALVTSLLFSLGKFLIEFYIGKSGVESSYGAAGTLVVLLVWVYYSAQIFLLGAEFTKVYAESHGSRMHLKPRTVSSTDIPSRA
jgi:membrane protein